MSTVTVPYYSGITNTGAITGSITMPATGAGFGGNTGTLTISNGGSNYTIGAGAGTYNTAIGAGASFNWKMPEEFVDAFPAFDKIQKMCDEYPGLKIAYEKFVTTYKMVKDDYESIKKDSE
jgi:hypothetical protein